MGAGLSKLPKNIFDLNVFWEQRYKWLGPIQLLLNGINELRNTSDCLHFYTNLST